MIRRSTGVILMMGGLIGMLLVGLGGTTSANNHLGVPHNPDGQVFLTDSQICLGGSSSLTGNEDATTFPAIASCASEVLTPGASVSPYRDLVLQKGNRLALPYSYTSVAFGFAPPTDGTTVGSVKAAVNLGCDDNIDFLGDGSSTTPYGFTTTLVPGALFERTLGWGPGTGAGGADETFLTALLPGSGFTRTARVRADVDLMSSLPNPLVVASTVNNVTLTPTWGASRVTATVLGGSGDPPSAELLCMDSPMTSNDTSLAAVGVTNPGTPGLYPMWTVEVSTPGIRDEQQQAGSLVTYCKQIGGSFTDADNDCLSDASDTNTANSDQDADGIPDGLELTWLGSIVCPSGGLSPVNTADCDGDGRTDYEEMVEPAPYLTNPRVADTDGDGFRDAGLIFDCNGDGAPDRMTRENAGAGTGRQRIIAEAQYCWADGSKNTTTGPGLGGRPIGNPGAATDGTSPSDNCPNNYNTTQTNTSLTDPDLDALPAAGDANGHFSGTADLTHPDAHFGGNACDGDRDGDAIPDAVEDLETMFYNSAGTDSKFCNLDGAGVAADTDSGNRDSDGDGAIDGVECELGKNPADPTSKPGITLSPEQQTFFRMTQLTQPGGTARVDLDDGSLNGGVQETRGMGAGGAASNDSDRDGCADEVERADVDGNRTAGDADRLGIARGALGIAPFTAFPTIEEIRTADLDYNGDLGDTDRLGVARIVLSATLANVPDYQLNCKITAIGYDAN